MADEPLTESATPQAVLTAWTELGLDALRPIIDRQALALSGNEERSKQARKGLSDLLKAMKTAAGDPDQSKKATTDAIRAFQKEIDELTKRAVYAETCFTQVYSLLYPLPDPVPMLQRAVQHTQDQKTVKALQGQIREYDKEFSKMKNQEVTIRRLEDRIRELEQNASQQTEATLELRTKQFETERSQLINEARNREQQLQQEIVRCRDLLLKTQTQCDELQSQLFAIHDRKDQDAAARDTDSNRMLEELQSANTTIMMLQHEKADLQAELQRASDISSNADVLQAKQQASDASHRLMVTMRELEAARSQIATYRARNVQDEESRDVLERRHAAELAECHGQIAMLQEALSSLPSAEEFARVKTQLKLLQVVQFNSAEDEGDHQDTALERTLLQKNQKLESDLARLRCENISIGEQLSETNNGLKEATEEIVRLNATIRELEHSLASHSSKSANVVQAALLSDKADIDAPDQILLFQRDRYKKAAQAMEAEKAAAEGRCQTLSAQLASLQADNEKLYQKLRQIQTFNRRGNADDIEAGNASISNDPTVNKYETLFNERQNPFTNYTKAQRQQGYANLNVMEKVIFNSAKMVLGNKTLRTGTFFYMLALHLLVFVSLVTHTFISHCPKQGTLHLAD
ncbi:Protein CASP [Plasmodiophora brassicae]|uniref:Protein CASP n=1 Tax=Plasmodiophora brassicae TaxID=37360 RepID=A0A3P3YEV6_PLABS|nr:unnamed protein product [Plasmodiophora brassicae]